MTKVCTEDVYWEGIRKANSDRDRITGDMRSFIEIVPDGDGYKFVRDMDSYNAAGVKADDIPGWYDAQQYRCFRSSNSAVVSHENLLLTQPKYNTRITIDSVLTYTEYAKYYGGRPAGCARQERLYLQRHARLHHRYHRPERQCPLLRRQGLRPLVRLDVHRQRRDAHFGCR